MTLPRLYELEKYWGENPPLHLMIKQYLGFKGTQGEDAAPPQNTGDILGMLGGGDVVAGGQSPLDILMAPYLDKKVGHG